MVQNYPNCHLGMTFCAILCAGWPGHRKCYGTHRKLFAKSFCVNSSKFTHHIIQDKNAMRLSYSYNWYKLMFMGVREHYSSFCTRTKFNFSCIANPYPNMHEKMHDSMIFFARLGLSFLLKIRKQWCGGCIKSILKVGILAYLS